MMTATYSPEDNKLRLYSTSRLDSVDYDRVKRAGFKWAPRQELFVAPAWTPAREDLLIELCGSIDDEDTSLVQRAEERSDRFEEYSDKRHQDAERAHAAVAAIADDIPLGQPILVGHHSERHARKDAERIENGMRKAVKMWETSKYWLDRAADAIANAKYKERPDVRARRIKKLESDLRGSQKSRADAARAIAAWTAEGLTLERAKAIANYDHIHKCFLLSEYPRELPASQYEGSMGLWSALTDGVITAEQARDIAVACHTGTIRWQERWIAHLKNRLAYERAMLAEGGGLVADKHDLQPGGQVLVGGEWMTILRVNKKNGVATSVSTNGRYVGKRGVEEIRDYKPPTEEIAAKVKAATKLPPMCNYPGDGFTHITQEEWNRRHADYKGSRSIDATATHGRHRVRSGLFGKGGLGSVLVYITDAKRKDPPAATVEAPRVKVSELPHDHDVASLERQAAASQAFRDRQAAEAATPFAQLKESLKNGVKVVSAPQLFPTPPDVADQVVQLAEIEHNHRILEPSAGTGNLIAAVMRRDSCANVVAVEIRPAIAEQLRSRFGRGNYNCEIRCADFLDLYNSEFPLHHNDIGTFDRIVMNPPFGNAADIKHIEHARTLLNPGGRLVAICANGPRQRERLEPIATAWIDLPDDTFKDQGTGVRTAIVVIDAA
jgi:protein-L-isoaspartate O-methyltransferase